MRSEGRTGRRWVPRATNSLNMSFWTVPRRTAGSRPRCLATATSIERRTIAVELIVIEIETFSSGMASSRVSMSPRWAMETPTRPTSPRASGWSGS